MATPLKNNGIIRDHSLDSFSAHNSMNLIWSIVSFWHWIGNIMPHHTTGLLRFKDAHSCPVGVMGRGRIYKVISDNAYIGGRGSHVWHCFSQLFFHNNGELLCSLERKFPEFFKTHPTFLCSPLLMPSKACQTLLTYFLGHPVVCIKLCSEFWTLEHAILSTHLLVPPETTPISW